MAVFAYASDGRAYVDDWTAIGLNSPELNVNLDSIPTTQPTGNSSPCADPDPLSEPLDAFPTPLQMPWRRAQLSQHNGRNSRLGGGKRDSYHRHHEHLHRPALRVDDSHLTSVECGEGEGGGGGGGEITAGPGLDLQSPYQSTALRLVADEYPDVTPC